MAIGYTINMHGEKECLCYYTQNCFGTFRFRYLNVTSLYIISCLENVDFIEFLIMIIDKKNSHSNGEIVLGII